MPLQPTANLNWQVRKGEEELEENRASRTNQI